MKRVIEIKTVGDIVTARQSGRDISRLLGFGLVDQTKLATAISELTRNVIQYAGSGTCMITHEAKPEALVVRVEVEDRGPGIPDIDAAMVQGASTGGGWGAGLPGSKRLVERFEIDSQPGRTKVTLELIRPRRDGYVLLVHPAAAAGSAPDSVPEPVSVPLAEPAEEPLARPRPVEGHAADSMPGSASSGSAPAPRPMPHPVRAQGTRPMPVVSVPANASQRSVQPTGFDPVELPASISAAGLLSTVRVANDFGILQARQAARMIADTVGFSRVATCCIVTAVSELATNLVAHAVKGGLMTFTAVRMGDNRFGIEVSCVDEGPGMSDVASAVEGGQSTAGTLGAGLRAVTRMMDEVEIQSRAGRGSAIIARKWREDE